MKTHAYNSLYLEDAMNNLGTMLDCTVNAAQYDLVVFYEMFLSSGVASQMEAGNPRYLSGMSGMELMQLVLEKSSDKTLPIMNYAPFDRTPEYWAGWALAYYQWYSAYTFPFIQKNGLSISTVLSPHLSTRKNTLKTIRKQSHLTQKELADLSGVTLRMIQAYEQGHQDIMKAEARTVFALARMLGCTPEVICG